MCIRGPATSTSPGCTSSSTWAPSSVHESSRRKLWLVAAPPVTATASASCRRTRSAVSSSGPSTRTPTSSARSMSAAGTQAPSTSIPCRCSRAEHVVQLRGGTGAADQDDPAQVAAQPLRAVQLAAGHNPDAEAERPRRRDGHHRERDDPVLVDHRRGDGRGRDAQHDGTQHRPDLVVADPELLAVVAVAQGDGHRPGERRPHHQGEDLVLREHTRGRIEGDGAEHGDHRDQRVGQDHQLRVAPAPVLVAAEDAGRPSGILRDADQPRPDGLVLRSSADESAASWL